MDEQHRYGSFPRSGGLFLGLGCEHHVDAVQGDDEFWPGRSYAGDAPSPGPISNMKSGLETE